MYTFYLVTGAVIISAVGVGFLLLLGGTRRRSGKWGINLRDVACPSCKTPLAKTRRPTSLRQMLWGGWTCPSCGCEIDKWGAESPTR